MKMDYSGRLILNTHGTFSDLEKYQIDLKPGIQLVFYNDDEDAHGNPDNLVVAGVVDYDPENSLWVAEIDWGAIKNISQLSEHELQKLDL